MALPATISHTTCALPRRRRSTTSPARRRGPPSRVHPNSGVALTHRAAPPATQQPTLDSVLSDLESNPRLLTPDLLDSLLAALPRHPSPRRNLARLRLLLSVSLLRRYPALACRLLHLHASLGLVSYAHHLFDHLLPARAREDAFPWNCLIAGYSHLGRHDDAIALYLQMEEEAVPRDGFSFTSALQACAGVASLALGQAIHRDVVRAGLASDVSVCDALVDMYAVCGDTRRALQVFDAMPDRDEVSWNIMLVGCLRHGLSHQSMELWRRMLGEGHKPDSMTLSTMLSIPPSACDNGKMGLEIHAWAIRHGIETELSVANALIRMYSDKDKQIHALSVFESMTVRDLLSWNAIIAAHLQDYRILMIFRRMVDSGMRPDETTFALVLSACDKLGLVEGGIRLFSEMENEYRLLPTMEHHTSMVNMLGRVGMINEAYEFVAKRNLLNSEPSILRALLQACLMHRNTRVGEIVAKKLIDLEPDNTHNFIMLMEIYQNTGRLIELETVNKTMRDRGLSCQS
ncbi:pentatricopeptide repeat-containing protein At4g25270, chloroplastic-like [Oryza brachyantha]|uniref:Pentacotripeptide-repeat region of PRORP domain-containing protein n=1 Tax=Oryza brachyantha TaxID=4533 RepID=J3LUV0_ORYBR|nr:pentatricopeptide repeat-containing protein At4g25270, chloroplastic-like [Oryza brachyantha]